MRDGDRYALIVASDTHTDPRLSRLRAPAADADELARVLRDPDIGAFDVAISHNEPSTWCVAGCRPSSTTAGSTISWCCTAPVTG